MTKQEFESRAKRSISDNEYDKLEYVYAFHPSIDETKGKDQIALLWDTFGIRIIEDMMPTAKKAEELDNKIRTARIELDRLQDEYKELKM